MSLDRPLTVTFFASYTATHKREQSLSLNQLSEIIRDTTAPSKDRLPWLKLAQFGDKRTDKCSLRHDDNMLAISGVEGDYDSEITTIAEAVAVLQAARLAGMVYTSPSHTEDTPRWRVLCPLSAELAPTDRARYVGRLNGVFHGSLSRESFAASQSYYYGSVKGNPSHIVELIAGDYIDLRDDLEAGAIGKPKLEYKPNGSAPSSSDNADPFIAAVIRNALGRVSNAADGSKHHVLLAQARLLGGYQHLGDYSEHDAVEWLVAALPSSAKDRKAAAKTAAWGFEKGTTAPLERPAKPNGKHSPAPEAAGNVVRLKAPKPKPNLENDWKAAWHRTENGSPLPTLYNALIALRCHPPLVGIVALDEMQLSVIIRSQVPEHKVDSTIPRPIRDRDVIAVQQVLQSLGLRRLGKSTAQDVLDLIAGENGFHPVRDYLNSLKWDGTQRCAGWLGRYLGVEGSQYSDKIGKLFMIALVARIFQPGCQADYVLVLEGPQGALKSSACRVLAGKWFSDSLPDLTHADPVRLSMHLRGKWLIEIAELASFNASETETIKAFATKTSETYTPKYGHNEVTEPRQCLLIATTNQPSYLHDETGARRFWPVKVGTIDLPGLREARDQLFAEAVHLYRAGEPWWPERQFETTHIAPQQAARYEEDAWEGAIEAWLGAAEQSETEYTITEIARGAISMTLEKLGTREQRRIRRVLMQLGWTQLPSRKHGRKWLRPAGTHIEGAEKGDAH